MSSCDRGEYATVICRDVVNLFPELRKRDQAPTSELPKLPSHWKVPILQPSVGGGVIRRRANEAYENEKPKCCTKINITEGVSKVECALHDFFPDQAYLTFNKTWSQEKITRCSKCNISAPRQPGSKSNHKKGWCRWPTRNTG